MVVMTVLNMCTFCVMASPIDDLKITAPCAILVEASTGEVILEKNAHEPRPIASVTKIMTMTLVMEAIDEGLIKLDDMVTTSENASRMGGSQIWLEVGEQMTVSDMLKAVAIESANDAAVALAEMVAGTEEGFISMMNQKAQELGMNDTKFYNVNGLPGNNASEDNVSSAYDIALISMELLKHPDIHQWLTTWIDTLRGGDNVLTNTNKLIKTYEGADGIKTGYTDRAKYCLSATAKRNNIRMISVILGADTSAVRFSEAGRLMDYGFRNYQADQVVGKGQKVCDVNVSRGTLDTLPLIASDDLNVVCKKNAEASYETRLALPEKIAAPITAGDKIGELVAFKGDVEIAKVDIIASCDVPKRSIAGSVVKSFQDLFRQFMSFGKNAEEPTPTDEVTQPQS